MNIQSDTPDRRLAAIMFTDMVGYSALVQRDEAGALALLEEHNRLIRSVIAAHRGTEIKTVGDAFLIEFPSALAATDCALAIQAAIQARNSTPSVAAPMSIRIGIHLGDVVYRDNDVFGDGVNIAARIESLAPAGGICVSEDVARQVRNKLSAELISAGRGKLKNIELPMNVYFVRQAGVTPAGTKLTASQQSKAKWAAAVAILVAAMGLAGAWWKIRPSTVPSVQNTSDFSQSIAVLPFADLSPGKDHEYFSDGLSEEVLNLLTRIPRLKVIARTSSFSFKGTNKDIATIAKTLGVETVLEGSVRRSEDRIRVTAQLIRASDSAHLWSENFERKITDTFAIQDEIANAVVSALKVKLLPGQAAIDLYHYAARPESFDQFARGRLLLSHGGAGALQKANAAFAEARRLDPKYAEAIASFALTEHQLSYAEHTPADRERRDKFAFDLVEEAIRLAPTLGEAHAVRARMRMTKYDWAGAGKDLETALQLDANNVRIQGIRARFESAIGRYEYATAAFRRVIELDPLFVGPMFEFSRLQLTMGDIAGARKSIARVAQVREKHTGVSIFTAYADLMEGNAARVLESVGGFEQESDRSYLLALALHSVGDQVGAQRAAEKYIQEAPRSIFNHAQVRAWRGEHAEAIKLIQHAIELRMALVLSIRYDPFLLSLHGHPGFNALLAKLNLPPTETRPAPSQKRAAS